MTNLDLSQLGSVQLDWNLIILFGVFTTVFLVWEWFAKTDIKEYKLTFVKYFGWLVGSIVFHVLVNHIFKLKENPIANSLLSTVLGVLMYSIISNMVLDTNTYKSIKRELMKQDIIKKEDNNEKDVTKPGKELE